MKFFTLHGHFYQPPRENPWTGNVEKQYSAAPYHDWNERIFDECYKRNASASTTKGKRINNYRYLNFNFGPTLFHWLKEKHYDIYSLIVESDKISATQNEDHGNAIAMCYNHIIMPLANENDRKTQIIWGLKDFKFHFNRDAEAIWLPETACNYAAIEDLIENNVTYIILDPAQAEKVKIHNTNEWLDVSDKSIPPFQPYICRSLKNPDRFISIFFYDGPLSKSIAFDDILLSPEYFINRIKSITQPFKHELLNTATDGETFGHHKKTAHHTIAEFFDIAQDENIQVINYGNYLEQHSAKDEVIIKSGFNNEGTSWSCPHGVSRWKDDCGCGGGGEWHQLWRKPLREGLNELRDKIIEVFEKHGSEFLHSVWDARNDYIDIILNDSSETKVAYFGKHAKRVLTDNEVNTVLKLMEMQKFSMFMFTSCGWFFSEISGLETVQILQYAARAIELCEEVSGLSFELGLLEKLKEAKSNIPEYENGEGVWKKLVKSYDFNPA